MARTNESWRGARVALMALCLFLTSCSGGPASSSGDLGAPTVGEREYQGHRAVVPGDFYGVLYRLPRRRRKPVGVSNREHTSVVAHHLVEFHLEVVLE